MQATEHEGLLTVLLNLHNSSLTDINITVITINGTATGEIKNVHS